jgi:hypothetical protein
VLKDPPAEDIDDEPNPPPWARSPIANAINRNEAAAPIHVRRWDRRVRAFSVTRRFSARAL